MSPARKLPKDKDGHYLEPPANGDVGKVLVLAGWRHVATLKNETADLDEEAAQSYVRDIQARRS